MDEATKKKIAADCWKRGNDSVSKEDFEFAMKMYRQSVDLCPDTLVYRQSLRASEYKFYKNNQTGQGGMFVRGKVVKVRTRCKTARVREKWDDLDKAAEDGLAINPWDAQFNADVAEACYQRGYLEVASEAFKRAIAADQNNVEYLRAIGQVEEDRGNFVEAAGFWDKVSKLDPTDGDARRRANDNFTKRTIKDGFEDAKDTRDVARNAYEQGENRAGFNRREDKDELSTEEQLQRAVRKQPDQVEPYAKLGEFYKNEKRWGEAMEAYQQALDVTGGGDHNIRELLEDCEVEQLKQNFDLAKARAAESGDPKTLKSKQRIERELVLREMEILQARIPRYPNNSRMKYELAKRYMRFEQFKEAIPLFQQCVNDTRLQASVLVSLGKCFIGVSNESIAERQFQKAVDKLNPIDDPVDFCECHYFLGRLAEKKDQKETAENHYNEILSVDFEYKDVQRRLDNLAG